MKPDIFSLIIGYFDNIGDDLAFELVCKFLFSVVKNYHEQYLFVGEQKKKVKFFHIRGNYYIDVVQPDRMPRHDKDDPKKNFSSCRMNGSANNVTTIWYKIRVDPQTLKVHTGDATFAKTLGHWPQASPLKFITFGTIFYLSLMR